jgi:hypothetical protein
MNPTREVKLTGGVPCGFGKLKGKHLEMLTTTDNQSQKVMMDVLADVVQYIGSNKSISRKEIENLLEIDFTRLLIAVRNFSNGDEPCKVKSEWKNNGIPSHHIHLIDTAIEGFAVQESTYFTDTIAEYPVIPDSFDVEISQGKVSVNFLTIGKQIDRGNLFKKKSLLTALKMRVVSNAKGNINADELDFQDMTKIFEAIKEVEGSIDTNVVITNPKSDETKTINVIGQSGFFFPWLS